MARHPVLELVSGTLEVALSQSKNTTGLTVHSEHGWHYKMQPYPAMLAHCGVTLSMSRKGNCFDNAVIESFLGTGGQFNPGGGLRLPESLVSLDHFRPRNHWNPLQSLQ